MAATAPSGAGLRNPRRAASFQRAPVRPARAAAARARAARQPLRAHARRPSRCQLRRRYAPLLKLHVLSPHQTI